MKKIILVFCTLILSSVAVFAQTFQKDGSYDCKYQIDKNSNGSCFFLTDDKGLITSNICGPRAPKPEILINSGKCAFSPNKNYKCKFSGAYCNVKIIAGGGSEISCLGNTPDLKTVVEMAKAGKCNAK